MKRSACESFFDTISRREDKRYEVNLPFKNDHPVISDNFEHSKRRLQKLHEKLKKELSTTFKKVQ